MSAVDCGQVEIRWSSLRFYKKKYDIKKLHSFKPSFCTMRNGSRMTLGSPPLEMVYSIADIKIIKCFVMKINQGQ